MTENTPLRTRTLGDLLDHPFPERTPLLAPWLTEKHLSMVYAPTGVGKSWFALGVALAVAGGGTFLRWEAPSPRKVLFVDGEMDPEDLKERAGILVDTLGVDRDAVREHLAFLAHQDQESGVDFPDLATEDGQERVRGVIQEHQPALVVLDNFSTLATVQDENAAHSFDPIRDFLSQLKRDRRAVLLVHHARKGPSGEGSYRGTSKIGTIFQSIVALKQSPTSDGKGVSFDLKFEKLRSLGDDLTAPLRASLVHRGDSPQWLTEPLSDVAIERMLAILREGDVSTQQELADRLGVVKGTVSKWKRRAIGGGLVTAEEFARCLQAARDTREDDYSDDVPDF